jgi:hypothetical protein
MIESRRLPLRLVRKSVWLRAVGVSPSDWLEGIVVSGRKPIFRNCQLRIRFLAPFPYESFKTLVFVPDSDGTIAVPDTPEHEKNHFWK